MIEAENVLVIGDTHIPFEKKGYLDFCREQYKKYKCSLAVHIGDLCDNHSISYHEHHPDGMSAVDEIKVTRERLKNWYKAFPEVKLCKGNHDILLTRKAITYGLSDIMIRPYREIWELPAKWEYEWHFYISGVRYEHGTGYSGRYPHVQVSAKNRQSTVIGHCHSVAGVDFHANDMSLIFGMSTGCGIDRMQYTFWYGRDFRDKPILGCGVVLDAGKGAAFIPMKI